MRNEEKGPFSTYIIKNSTKKKIKQQQQKNNNSNNNKNKQANSDKTNKLANKNNANLSI